MILAHTIKGWTIDALEGKNATHQMKKLNAPTLKAFRDRLELPISDQEIDEHYEFDGSAPFYHPGEGSAELEYLRDRRRVAGRRRPDAAGRPAADHAARRHDVRRAQAGLGQAEDRHHDGASSGCSRT